MQINIDERKELAVAYFKEGYNCAQSVFMAYADIYDIAPDMAKKMSAPFGAGMGRMREVCGAASAMFMLMGFKYPSVNPLDKDAKRDNYAAVQRCGAAFKVEFGTLICADLLKIKRETQDPTPSDRNAEYYAKRPCAFFVVRAAEIVGAEINAD